MPENLKVSIIIVKYKSEEFLNNCLSSLGQSPNQEIIIVDNDKENVGYGEGCNRGARKAKGEYLFFLNPDTVVLPNTVDTLLNFMEKNEKVGIVAPLLLNKQNVPYPIQVTRELTPIRAFIGFSFLNKLFTNNPISYKYWFNDWDKTKIQEVFMIPGTAFLIKKDLFNKVGGFDKNFFLYFEETDLCQRIIKEGLKVYIDPEAKVVHYWEGSTPKDLSTKKIFKESRYYYFKKHWGILKASLVESFLRGSEWLAEKI